MAGLPPWEGGALPSAREQRVVVGGFGAGDAVAEGEKRAVDVEEEDREPGHGTHVRSHLVGSAT